MSGHGKFLGGGRWLALAASLAGCGSGATDASTETTDGGGTSAADTDAAPTSSAGPGTDDATTGSQTGETTDATTSETTDAGCVPMEVRACYSGTPGTQGIGVCIDGTQTCDATGEFGPCEGEVVPGDEDCATPEDEDCDGEALDADAGCVCGPGDEVACYSGPRGSAGIGVCHAGTATCEANGLGLGVCAGEVVPGTEDCATPEDEDCDDATPACPGAVQWAHTYGDETATQEAYAVAALPDGGSYLAGFATGTLDFGTGPLVSAQGSDVFLAKFTADGAAVWAKMFPGQSGQLVFDAETDPSGGVTIVGWFNGDVDFGGGKLVSAGAADIHVARFTKDGAHVWSKRFGGAALDFGEGVGVGPDGEVVVSGNTKGMIDFGGGPLVTAGGGDVVVAKFAANGAHQWSKRFGDASNQFSADVAVDSVGDVIVTGGFVGTIDLGGGPRISAGAEDIFLAKLAADGSHMWSLRFGDPADHQTPQSVVVDPSSGAIALAGYFEGTIDFGGGPLVSAGERDVFVAVLAADGSHVWSARHGGPGLQIAHAAAFGPGGEVLATGIFEGTLDLGGGPLMATGERDMWVAKFAADGSHVYSLNGGTAGLQIGYTIAADSSGAALVAGYFTETLEIGAEQFVSAGEEDLFFAKIGP